jgi:spore germination cell wall hydrolase CwlJ-like protein
MAASEFFAAAIAAFSIVQDPAEIPHAAAVAARCMTVPGLARALEVAPAVSTQPRVAVSFGCAQRAPRSTVALMIDSLRDWFEDARDNLIGPPRPRALVYVSPLPDPADRDPVQKAVREQIDEMRRSDPAVAIDRAQLNCLQRALYFEARGEGERGLAAVAHVALNRVGTRPNRATVCDVVREPGQFAPYLNGDPDEADLVESDEDGYQLAIEIAAEVMAGYLPDPSRGGRYFYAPAVLKVAPAWAKGLKETARVGGHRFFAEPQPQHETRVAVRN